MRFLKYFLSVAILFALTSCDFFERHGCTDYTADNYDAKASSNDGTCIYQSSGVIHWNANMNNFFLNNNVTHVTIELDGVDIVTQSEVSQYNYNSNPGCNDPDWPRFSQHIYKDYSEAKNIKLYNQNDSLVLSEVLLLGKGCNTYQIYY
ncbi:MAG: hypothetical protein ABJG50_16325 [Crocinitomicaceae bacterium]